MDEQATSAGGRRRHRPTETSAAPDWDGLRERTLCPLCEYDLRGQTEPRCPECGYRFEWSELTDPSRKLHRYLFEHHPERNAWSFMRTLAGGLRPRRFWTSLTPAQPSRPRRLVLYWMLAASLLFPVLVVHHLVWFHEHAAATRFQRGRMAQLMPPTSGQGQEIVRQYGSVEAWLDLTDPLPPSREFYRRAWREEAHWALFLAGVCAAWPWLTFLTLLVFRISMRRARIKPVHVLRCVLYSFDGVLWLAVGAAWAAAARVWWLALGTPARFALPTPPIPTQMPYSYRPELLTDTLFWLGGLLLLFMIYRLTQAFRLYLKFDRPVATVLASQVIVLLVVLVWTLNGFVMQ